MFANPFISFTSIALIALVSSLRLAQSLRPAVIFARVLFGCIAFLLLQPVIAAEEPKTADRQMTTEEHIAKPGWWPRKGDAARSDFVGSATCAECHSSLFKGQQQHAMAHSSSLVAKKIGAIEPAHLDQGPAHYSIGTENNNLVFKVRYNAQSFSAPLAWLFGSGHHGQTYLYRRAGEWWETRISIFRNFGPAITPGEPEVAPGSFTEALGRRIPDEELPKCFGCHTTAAVTSGKFSPESAIPGVSCEGCHGPGAAHVAIAHADPGGNPGMIFNPASLDAANSVDFCGSCHRTWWDVFQAPEKAVSIVRLPAYRLEQSRCWGNGDARITCVACHNPHMALVTESAQYDQKCLSCHVASSSMTPSADHPGAGCPVKSADCTSCHMPKYELPQMHSRFTDHRIRIVRDPGTMPN